MRPCPGISSCQGSVSLRSQSEWVSQSQASPSCRPGWHPSGNQPPHWSILTILTYHWPSLPVVGNTDNAHFLIIRKYFSLFIGNTGNNGNTHLLLLCHSGFSLNKSSPSQQTHLRLRDRVDLRFEPNTFWVHHQFPVSAPVKQEAKLQISVQASSDNLHHYNKCTCPCQVRLSYIRSIWLYETSKKPLKNL